MTDKSDALTGAIEIVFPDAEIRLCFFHVMQAWGRWLKRAENGIRDGMWQCGKGWEGWKTARGGVGRGLEGRKGACKKA